MRLAIVIVMMSCCHVLAARTIYVSPQGDHRSGGGSPVTPLRSINHATALARAGDTVLLLEGVYKELIRIRSAKGKPDQPVCIMGINEQVVIDGGAAAPAMNLNNNWIELDNTSWIVFRGLSFINGWTDPIRVHNSSYISFQHCRFSGGRKVILGTGVQTHHLLVEECSWDQGGSLLWNIDKDSRGVDAWLSMHHELMGYFNGTLVDSRGSGGSYVVRRNRIRNAYNGIRFTSKKGYDANIEVYENDIANIRDNDFEPEHYAFNLHIYHNRSHNIHKTFSVDDVAGGYIYYYGNTVTMDSSAWSRKIGTGFSKIYGGVDSLTGPLYFFNNSFFGYGKGFNAMENTARMLKHFNNAYYFAGDYGWVLEQLHTTNAFDYDIVNKPWPANIQQKRLEQHGKIADVRFADVFASDLHLLPGSPAIDGGTPMVFPELGWEQGFSGAGVDVGAYENGELVEGPPFRFRKPPGAAFDYVETPRIVRYKTDGNKLYLYFSDAMDKQSLSAQSIRVQNANQPVHIQQATLTNGYEWILEADQPLHPAGLAIRFIKTPVSVKGVAYTNWASAIPIISQKKI